MVGRPLRKVICGARRKYDGQPCQAKARQNGRCYLHGGMSTGALTIEGRINALMGLKQFKGWSREDVIRKAKEKNYYRINDGEDIDIDLQRERHAIAYHRLPWHERRRRFQERLERSKDARSIDKTRRESGSD